MAGLVPAIHVLNGKGVDAWRREHGGIAADAGCLSMICSENRRPLFGIML
jgi:hypothetical protein